MLGVDVVEVMVSGSRVLFTQLGAQKVHLIPLHDFVLLCVVFLMSTYANPMSYTNVVPVFWFCRVDTIVLTTGVGLIPLKSARCDTRASLYERDLSSCVLYMHDSYSRTPYGGCIRDVAVAVYLMVVNRNVCDFQCRISSML
jgi:hypothetical protein